MIQPQHRSSRRGSMLVETALTFLVFIAVLVGTLDLAQVLFFHQIFNERVRAGARWAAVHAYDAQRIENVVLYNNPNPPGDPGRTGLFGLKPSEVAVNRYGAGTEFDRIEIVISNHPLSFYSPFLGGSYAHRPLRAVIPVESLGALN
ncbi:MAG: pilus assembly protein [Bryobacterales bacterium]|nr:pilus assembly protein [Bryobacterales bacterium]